MIWVCREGTRRKFLKLRVPLYEADNCAELYYNHGKLVEPQR
jgi:hypothetical protein